MSPTGRHFLRGHTESDELHSLSETQLASLPTQLRKQAKLKRTKPAPAPKLQPQRQQEQKPVWPAGKDLKEPPEPDVPGTELEKLRIAANVLQLLHIRNRNQHRMGTWWRYFSAFRRQLRNLVEEKGIVERAGEPADPPGTNKGRETSQSLGKRGRDDALRAVDAMAKRRTAVVEARVRAEKRVRFWEEHCVGEWWAAFEQLLGDLQWSPIALVLLGVVAEVCEVLGISRRLKGDGGGEDEVRKTNQRSMAVEEVAEEGNDDICGEDIGVRVERVEDDMLAGGEGEVKKKRKRESSEPELAPAKGRNAKERKKSKRKGDTIDDLFSGLI